jgi:hypothetical protein
MQTNTEGRHGGILVVDEAAFTFLGTFGINRSSYNSSVYLTTGDLISIFEGDSLLTDTKESLASNKKDIYQHGLCGFLNIQPDIAVNSLRQTVDPRSFLHYFT